MDFVTLPEKCLGLKLRKNYHSSFYVNNENLLVHPIEQLIEYILLLIKKNESQSNCNKRLVSKLVENSWLNYYYDIIYKKESSFLARFLGKEFLYRRIVTHVLFTQKDLFGEDPFLSELCKDADYPYILELVEMVENNLDKILFSSKKFRPICRTTKLTPLEFYKRMIIAFPFELKSYKFWIENILLYNIHNELTII